MLQASRAELESACRVRMLKIRERELLLFVRNTNQVATLSALLAGFGYTGLIYTKYIDEDLCDPQEFMCAEMTYPLCVTITTCFSTFSLFGCMLITLLAPVLALRGPQGSMDKSVDIMVQEYQYVLFLFACAVIMFFVSAIIYSFSLKMPIAYTLITLLSLGSVYAVYRTAGRAFVRFDVPRHELVTGRFSEAYAPPQRPARGLYTRLSPISIGDAWQLLLGDAWELLRSRPDRQAAAPSASAIFLGGPRYERTHYRRLYEEHGRASERSATCSEAGSVAGSAVAEAGSAAGSAAAEAVEVWTGQSRVSSRWSWKLLPRHTRAQAPDASTVLLPEETLAHASAAVLIGSAWRKHLQRRARHMAPAQVDAVRAGAAEALSTPRDPHTAAQEHVEAHRAVTWIRNQ